MNELVRDQWFWSLALTLISKYDFQIIESPFTSNSTFVDERGQRLPHVLLLRNKGRHFELLRLQSANFVWNSTLGRDIRSFADDLPTMKKKLKANKLDVYNIYLFPFTPIEYPFEALAQLQEITEGKTTLYSSAAYFKAIDLATHDLVDLSSLHLANLHIDKDLLYNEAYQLVYSLSIDEMKGRYRNAEKEQEERFKQVFFYGKPILTISFLCINLILYLLMEYVGSSTDMETLRRFGAKWPADIIAGEYWRFLTPMFLHIGFFHIMVNSLALYHLGGTVERIFGSKKFLWIYLFAGFLGTLSSFTFNPHLAAGASGAIFGCFGALLYFGWKRKNLFFRTLGSDILFVLILNIGIGFALPIVDNYGHLGGLLGGFLAAGMLGLPLVKQSLLEKLIFLILGVAIILLCIFFSPLG